MLILTKKSSRIIVVNKNVAVIHFVIDSMHKQKCILSGKFSIPVDCLIEPSEDDIIRQPDEKFISALKVEMLIDNKMCDVAPIIRILRLASDEQCDCKHLKHIFMK